MALLGAAKYIALLVAAATVLLLLLELRPSLIGLDHLTWRLLGKSDARRLRAGEPPEVQPKDVGDQKIKGLVDAANESEHCVHGVYDKKKKTCHCDPGWRQAGITDTINFLEGKCEQFECQSDEMCAEVLQIPGAWCPIKGWNCYCGWAYAFSDGWEGYETSKGPTHGGKCMGVMYTFSFSISMSLKHFMTHAWKVFLLLTCIFAPFGRKRANCDHHRPSLWRGIRTCFGCPSRCRGECVMSSSTFSLDSLQDDFAWSIYALDLGVWSYLFMVTLWVVAESTWAILLWTLVMLIIVVSAICGMIAMCGEGLGSCEASMGCDCCCAAGAGGVDGAGLSCADCCGLCAMHTGHSTGQIVSSDAFYWGGTFPYDPWWGYSGYGYDYGGGNDACCGGCCKLFCRPIAWLLYVFPAMPENVWGGIVGYFIFGTHVRTPPERLYRGGNAFIEFMGMSWRRTADLHDDDAWRSQVYHFLTEESPQDSSGTAQGVHPSDGRTGSQNVSQPERVRMQDGSDRNMIHIGRARAVLIDKAFDQEEHQCVKSSYEDYVKNECWICTGGCEEWDMWLSCKHLFCKACSTEMLKRRMPCPLCRVSSSTVLRGKAVNADEMAKIEREQKEIERRRKETAEAQQRLERSKLEAAREQERKKEREERERKAREEEHRLRILQEEEAEKERKAQEERTQLERGDSMTEPLLATPDRSRSPAPSKDVGPEVITATTSRPIQMARQNSTRLDETSSLSKEETSSASNTQADNAAPEDALVEVKKEAEESASEAKETTFDDLLGEPTPEEPEEDPEQLAKERAEKQKRMEELERLNRERFEQQQREIIERRRAKKALEVEAGRKQAQQNSTPEIGIATEKATVTVASGIEIKKVAGEEPQAVPPLLELVAEIDKTGQIDLAKEFSFLSESNRSKLEAALEAVEEVPKAVPSLMDLVAKIDDRTDLAKELSILSESNRARLQVALEAPKAVPSLMDLVAEIDDETDLAKEIDMLSESNRARLQVALEATITPSVTRADVADMDQVERVPSLAELVNSIDEANVSDVAKELQVLSASNRARLRVALEAVQESRVVPSLMDLVAEINNTGELDLTKEFRLLSESNREKLKAALEVNADVGVASDEPPP